MPNVCEVLSLRFEASFNVYVSGLRVRCAGNEGISFQVVANAPAFPVLSDLQFVGVQFDQLSANFWPVK